MPLPLSDPRWKSLTDSWGRDDEVVDWLTAAYSSAEVDVSDEWFHDVMQHGIHQGAASEITYALLPHLVHLARRETGRTALVLLCYAGVFASVAGTQPGVECPEFLRADYVAAMEEAAGQLLKLLPGLTAGPDRECAVGSIAALCGAADLGNLIYDLRKTKVCPHCKQPVSAFALQPLPIQVTNLPPPPMTLQKPSSTSGDQRV